MEKDLCALWKVTALEIQYWLVFSIYADGMTEAPLRLARFKEISAVGIEQKT